MDPTKGEFPAIPKDFDELRVSPTIFDFAVHKELVLNNHSRFAVLFKVKCTDNKRIKVEHCADILMMGNSTKIPIKKLVDDVSGDSLHVIYTLVGTQWHDARMSVYNCWVRVRKQNVYTKSIAVRVKKKENSLKSEKSEKKKKEKKENTEEEE